MNNIRNFCIIAHIDHGKSTLADRLLEFTGTVEKREMREQLLDQMDIERERGITIKLAPARMTYKTQTVADTTQTVAETDLLYSDLTYKLCGAIFAVRKQLGLGHKENVYQNALQIEFKKIGLPFENEKIIDVIYDKNKVGVYRPDFVIDNKVIVELKALSCIGQKEEKQLWNYLRGTFFRLGLLVNFSLEDVDIRRVIFDQARNVNNVPRQSASSLPQSAYILNLIDTPGHVDFTYEVSRSLAAVEGAIILVDATQGVQAQTIGNLYLALEQNLTIIPVVNKIDLPNAQVEKAKSELISILGCPEDEIILASGKTGQGVPEILQAVIERIPPPKGNPEAPLRALIFDSVYDEFKGVIAYVRVVDGAVKKNEKIHALATNRDGEALEVGYFHPKMVSSGELKTGEIGYIVTALKDISAVRVGDTITSVIASSAKQSPRAQGEIATSARGGLAMTGKIEPLPGYKEVKPMVYAGLFPRDQSEFEDVREGLAKLRLNDAALIYEPERSAALGPGFRAGFLGLLHLEIVQERLRREYNLELVVTVPSVAYKVYKSDGSMIVIKSAPELPDPSVISKIEEPFVKVDIVTPRDYLGQVMGLCAEYHEVYKNTEFLTEDRAVLHFEMPLGSILVDFYDKLKSASSGYASLNYEFLDWREADIVRLNILIAEEDKEELAKLVYRDEAHRIGRGLVETLKDKLPKQQFEIKLQAAIGGKVVAAERISPLRKDVTAKLYGGDVTRKMKLLKKQKEGKKRRGVTGSVEIPPEAYLAILKK